MDKSAELAIRSKLPKPGECVKDCPKCGGQGHYHGKHDAMVGGGTAITVETCPGPDTPIFTIGEMRAVLWELDAERRK